jgi:hypothetical protein
MAKVGDKYTLLGTDNVFEITNGDESNWVIKIITPQSIEVNVLMSVSDLTESVINGNLHL